MKSYAQPVTLLCAWPLMKPLVFPFLTSYKVHIVRMQFKVKRHSELIAQNANSQEFILTVGHHVIISTKQLGVFVFLLGGMLV